MSKNYFLLFGSRFDDVDIVSTVLSDVLNITFERRESSYVGNYNIYQGPLADKLSIESNLYPEVKQEKFTNFKIIINASFIKGSASQKQINLDFIKEKLEEIDKMILLRETVMEGNKIIEEKFYNDF